jgi:hypothetical protein
MVALGRPVNSVGLSRVTANRLSSAWFEIGLFWVTQARGNRRLSMPVQLLHNPTEAVSLPRSCLMGLERSESQQSEPMWMAFTRHHFAGTFALALRTLAAHETPMVQKAT